MMPAGPRSTRVEVLCQERLHLTSFLNLPSACYRNIMVLDEFRDQLCSLVLYLRPLEADTSCVTLRLLANLECKPHPALRCAGRAIVSMRNLFMQDPSPSTNTMLIVSIPPGGTCSLVKVIKHPQYG